MPRKSHEFEDGRCTRCNGREGRAGELCFLTDYEHDEIDFEDGLVNAAVCYWWDDMRPHEVRGLAIEAYMRGRLMAPMSQPSDRVEIKRLRECLQTIRDALVTSREEPFWIEDDADGYWCCQPGCQEPAHAPDVTRCLHCNFTRPAAKEE